MIILFQNVLFLKEWLFYLIFDGCFGLFTKIKKGFGASFWSTFSVWFLHKIFYVILYQLTKFQCHTFFPSQNIKQNMLLSSYLDNWWRFIFNHPRKQWSTGKKELQAKIEKFKYLENENNFLDEIKSIFRNYLRAIIWWRHKL